MPFLAREGVVNQAEPGERIPAKLRAEGLAAVVVHDGLPAVDQLKLRAHALGELKREAEACGDVRGQLAQQGPRVVEVVQGDELIRADMGEEDSRVYPGPFD